MEEGGHAESYGSRVLVSITRRMKTWEIDSPMTTLGTGTSVPPLEPVQNAQVPCYLGVHEQVRTEVPYRPFQGEKRHEYVGQGGGVEQGWSLTCLSDSGVRMGRRRLRDAINESWHVEWHVAVRQPGVSIYL